MFSKTIINKRLNDLTSNRKKAYRMILTWIDLSPSFLKTGTTVEDFQQEGKQDLAKNLSTLARTGESSGEHILRTMAGILSESVVLDASRW